ncbi:DsbA family protein [Tateyamaria sp. SN3-11]|uniref:DsbA family protein n=1 Tax=Tateyamaria sp. SN3-11 TaxID=3092147 RepID=UPI0039E77564
MKKTKLIYGHDTLCGWCFGFTPTLDAFAAAHPDIEIDVIPGGLVRGERVGSYADMADYIAEAEVKMTGVTGRAIGQPFREMLQQEDAPLSISAPPSLAILQMKKLAPDRALEFAHILQDAHFLEGKDVNLAATYDDICAAHGFPALDTDAIAGATEDTPDVAASYAQSAELGIQAYPTILVLDENDRVLGQIDSIYEIEPFTARFNEIINTKASEEIRALLT